MAIQVSSFLVPKNFNSWYILEDRYLKGGLRVCTTLEEREAIPPESRKHGMLVVVQAEEKMWMLNEDLETWKEFKTGGGGTGVRQKVVQRVRGLASQDHADFALQLGQTALILALEVDTVVQVEAFEHSTMDDTNPYRFVATDDHLIDDGSTKMTDGTILRGRRYSIFCNQDPIPTQDIYFRITNIDAAPATGEIPVKDVTLTLTFLPLEGVN